jgi:hypothetical protein
MNVKENKEERKGRNGERKKRGSKGREERERLYLYEEEPYENIGSLNVDLISLSLNPLYLGQLTHHLLLNTVLLNCSHTHSFTYYPELLSGYDKSSEVV